VLEQQYLQSHQALLSQHYQSSFLCSFPTSLQTLDDRTGVSMVDAPDENSAVFCRVLRDAGRVEVHSEAELSEVELKRGDVWVLRWSAVREGVRRGDVELM
jgi:GINS complex subunit 4